ncbi:DUF2397 family protein [Streptomyces sp. NRRL S-1824]|uniref:DUF2397 family protein n=1 Tax=Streptomyces sp. NRRL S-1824 TaxID=1463889 RepID=UPI00099C7E16
MAPDPGRSCSTTSPADVSLLQVLDRITEPHRRSSSAVQDFRELARWFAVAPREQDLYDLMHPDPNLIPAAEPWSEAPLVEVSTLRRTRGRTERFSRTAKVRDIAVVKTTRAEQARTSATGSRLGPAGHRRPGRPIRSRRAGPHVFECLLDLLGRALSAPAGWKPRCSR